MPIYEYRCQDCGAVFEKIVTLNANSVQCQKCQSTRLEKLFSTFAVSVPNHSSPCHEAGPSPCNSCGAAQQGMCHMME